MIYATMDIETTGLSRFKCEITWIGIGLAHEIGEPFFKEYYFKWTNPKSRKHFKKVCELLRKHKVRCIWQNGKFDTLFIEFKTGIRLPISDDIMLMGTVYQMSDEHGLKKMAKKYLGVPDWDIPKKQKLSGDATTVKPYLKLDVLYTWELFGFFSERLNEIKWKQYRLLLRPAYRAYRDVERNGLPLDQKLLKSAQKTYKVKQQEKLHALEKVAKINWNSSDQIQQVLFGKMHMPVIKSSEKTGKPSADAKSLRRLAAKGYKLPEQILDYKATNTIIKMFLNRWGDDSSYDGRIHPSFGLTNVRTGRTSCSEPNLQQVPRQQDIRSMFRAPKGFKMFEADYSQLELRIAAHYAREPTMLDVYAHDGDIHTETAKTFTGGREPTKPERNRAKAVNFGFIYGMGAGGFVNYAFDSYNQVFSMSEARHYRDLFFMKYSRLLPWHEEMAEMCEAEGGVANLFGRFRSLPDIYSTDKGRHNAAARRAINTPVQSTGSDLLISAMTQINKETKNEGVQVCCTVHDSIIGIFPDSAEEWLVPYIKKVMAHPKVLDDFGVQLRVKLDCDVGIGPWGTH